MAFVSGRVNRNISNRKPVDYFPVVISDRGVDALQSQGIPVDERYWPIDQYREFLEQRRIVLAAAINKFIDGAASVGRAVDIRLE